MNSTLAFLEAALKLAPLLIQAGADIAVFARQVYDAINTKGEPTPEDWALLEAKQKELRDILHAPLPPEA